VRLGIVPDLEFHAGVRVGRVLEGSPASASGLAQSDVVLSLGGAPLPDLSAYAQVLRRFRPGQSTQVVIERAHRRRRIQVTFRPLAANEMK
jgi:S1-C subfamily serine protease